MEQAGQVLIQVEESENLAQLSKALGDSSRLKILFQILSSESCVGKIAQNLKMSEAAVSHHLRVLRMNRLVRRRRDGKEIFYQLDDAHVQSILAQGCEHLEEFSLQNRAKS